MKTEPKYNDRVKFMHYGVEKYGTVKRVAHDIVYLTDGRWLHLESVEIVKDK